MKYIKHLKARSEELEQANKFLSELVQRLKQENGLQECKGTSGGAFAVYGSSFTPMETSKSEDSDSGEEGDTPSKGSVANPLLNQCRSGHSLKAPPRRIFIAKYLPHDGMWSD